MTLTHIATREGRLISFLRGELGLSHGLMKRLKYQAAYRVGGLPARTNHPVKPGDVITVTIEEDAPDIPAEDGALSILYEDEAIIAIDKPAGLLTHPTFHRIDGTLANRLAGYYAATGQRSAVHLVSRLDRDTFGVVLVAKNAHMHAILCGHLMSGAVEKTYAALVCGRPRADHGEIAHPIARLSPTSLLRCVRADGKPARTAYAVQTADEHLSLLRLSPLTGRTHQLRVHCAHEGFPILGDQQYGTEASLALSEALGFTCQQLCAASLVFPHPLTGERMIIHSRMQIG